MAHLLLALSYPENAKLTYAADCMFKLSNSNTDRSSEIKTFSTRTVARFRELAAKARLGKSTITLEGRAKLSSCFKGRKLSEEQKQLISKSRLGKYIREDNPFFKKNHTEKTKEILSKKSIERFKDKINHPRYGAQLNESIRNKISMSLKGREVSKESCSLGELHKSWKVLGPNGKVYNNITQAARDTNHDRATVSRWINGNVKNNHGFSWITN